MELVCAASSKTDCLNCSDVFNYYSKRKYEALDALHSKGDSDNLPLLDVDNHCHYNLNSYGRLPIKEKMGQNKVTSNKFFKCENCRLLDYLLDVNGKFPIIFKCVGLQSAEIIEVPEVGIIKKYVNDIIYLDRFTNDVILNWYLEKNNFMS